MKLLIVLGLVLVHSIKETLLSPTYPVENDLEEKAIIQSILVEENDVESMGNEKLKKVKPRPRTPQYPIAVLSQFEQLSSTGFKQGGNRETSPVKLRVNNKEFSKPRDRIFHVWLPVEIMDASSMNHTQVIFQQTLPRESLGSFTACQITLTLRDAVEVGSRTFLKMYTQWENNGLKQESIQTIRIVPDQRFHSFDITNFMMSCLKTKLIKPHFFKIAFETYETNEDVEMKIDFSSLFDVQVDMPLIMFFYGGFVPTTKDAGKVNTRKRRSSPSGITQRSVPSRPTSRCQRRSFTVKPEAVDWHDLVEPKELDLGYCSGSCPFPLEDNFYNFTLHSFLLDRYRLHHVLSTPSDFPQSTCVPVTYKPISVLESSGVDKIDAGVVYNLVVENCGCR